MTAGGALTGDVASYLARAAADRPDAPALLLPRRGDAYDAVTYRELHDDACRIARGLAALGVGRGDRAALLVPPGRDFLALVFAMFLGGVVPVVVDPAMGAGAVGACLAEARPIAFVGVAKAHAARAALGWAKETLRVRVVVGSRLPLGGTTLDEVRRRGASGAAPAHAAAPADVAAILFTSGSTGAPKGAEYGHGNFAAQAAALRDAYDIRPGEIDLATFPLFALFGPALGLTTVVPRMDFTHPGRTDPRAILGPVQRLRVTNLFANPALLRRVVDGTPEGTRLPSLRRIICAGAPVAPDTLLRAAALLEGGAQVHTPYGATEALPVATIGSDEILAETAARTAAGAGFCVGRPVPGVTVRIVRVEDAAFDAWSEALCVAPGEIGEVVVAGDVVTQAYFAREEATRRAKIPDGARRRHRMGDLAWCDEAGRLWFCGRVAERVVLPHTTLHTAQVEPIFDAHPLVARSALVGVAGPGGMRAVLCVELVRRGEVTPALADELRALGARHAHTRDVTTFLAHPGFPVDARHNAKIRRGELAAWAAARLG